MTMRRVTLALVALSLLATAAVASSVALGSGGSKQDGDQPPPGVAPVPKATFSNGVEKKSQWAVINSNGTVARASKNFVSSIKLGGTGSYQVDFKKVISNCALVAGLGVPGTGSNSGSATTAQRAGDQEHGVFVATTDTTGASADRSFHLIVACGG